MLAWVTGAFRQQNLRPAEVLEAESAFATPELDAVRRQFAALVPPNQQQQSLSDAALLHWARLDTAAAVLQEGVCALLRRAATTLGRQHGGITLDALLLVKARAERLDSAAAEDTAFALMDVDGSGAVPLERLQLIVLGLLQLTEAEADPGGLENHSRADAAAAAAAAAAAIAHGACALACDALLHQPEQEQRQQQHQQQQLTRDGFHRLCKTSPALRTSLCRLLRQIPATTASGSTGSTACRPEQSTLASASAASPSAAATALPAQDMHLLLPLPQLDRGQQHAHLGGGGLMQPAWAWLLAPVLPPDMRVAWKLLYCSALHGASFSGLLARVVDASPTLLLVRDKGGAVFGGIASSAWAKCGAFYGDHACCIFSLLPAAVLYPASGINANLQWCGVSFRELPNGIGFGGQVGQFGLSLDATLDAGMSRPNATYASPCLASAQTFEVDAVEVWLLRPPEQEDDRGDAHQPPHARSAAGSRGGGRSALDAVPGADIKLLEWAGVHASASAGLREPAEPIE